MTKFSKIISLLLIVSVMFLVGFPSGVYAQSQDPLGIEDFEVQDIVEIATQLVCWIFWASAFGLVIFYIVEGIKMMAAKGNPQKAAEARKALFYVFIATIVIVGSGVIVVSVASALGVDVTFTCELIRTTM